MGLRVNVNHTWQQERASFTTSSRGDSNHVLAGKSDGPSLNLNRRRLLKACLLDGIEDVFGERGLVEGSAALWGRTGYDRNFEIVELLLIVRVGALGDFGVFEVEVLFESFELVFLPVDTTEVVTCFCVNLDDY